MRAHRHLKSILAGWRPAVFSFMDWGVFALRSYHYLLLSSRFFIESELTSRTWFNGIWLMMAFLVPMLFWFPGRRVNKGWFILLELLLGGSYYVNSVFHPDLASKADYLLPSLTMGYLMSKRTLWVIPAVTLIPFTFQTFLKSSWEQTLSIGTDNLLFCFIGIWVSFVAKAYHQKNEMAAEIEQQNKLLTLYAAEIENMTLLEERNRLSKELHDTLGHSFISLIMSLDATIALMDRKPAEVKERLIRLRELTEQNLDEMRSTVHEMGEEALSLKQKVEALVNRLREHTGIVLNVNLVGNEPPLRFEMQQTVLRVIQESFTNALKHGKASQLDLELQFSESMLHLIIRNNGKPISKLEYGFGLTTMKHRIEQWGGSLRVSSEEGNEAMTQVRCNIPIKGVIGYDQN
jgi:signal transduction histidine kinase